MIFPLFRLMLAVVVLTPAPVIAQTAKSYGMAPVDNSQYILFIHTGPQLQGDSKMKQIAVALVRKGYSVRATDSQKDEAGGRGVDYFYEQDLKAAQDVADTVNDALARLGFSVDGSNRLKPRLQRVKNPRGYLGVWLF
jgi:hypothetical protein